MFSKFLATMIFTMGYSLTCAASPDFILEETPETCSNIMQNISDISSAIADGSELMFAGTESWIFDTRIDFSLDYGLESSSELLAFERFNGYLNELGVQLVIAYVPNRAIAVPSYYPENLYDETQFKDRVSQFRAALKQFSKYGAIVPDLVEISQSQGFYWKRDTHWAPKGAEQVAKTIANELAAKTNLIQENGDENFQTKENGVFSINGLTLLKAEKICGCKMPNQYVKTYRTTKLPTENELSLFGDSSSDELDIVLLGTSFSDVEALNFRGYLEQSLNNSITNHALSGGQAKGAWINYLSGEFRETKPDVIIWELPSYYNLNDRDIFAQLNPMFYDGCKTDSVRETEVSSFSDGGIAKSLLFEVQALPYPEEGLVLDMQFNDLDVRTVEIDVWSTSGNKKNLRLKSSERARASGRFMFEISKDNAEDKFMAFDIVEIFMRDGTKASQEVVDQLNATVKLCHIPAPSELAMAQ